MNMLATRSTFCLELQVGHPRARGSISDGNNSTFYSLKCRDQLWGWRNRLRIASRGLPSGRRVELIRCLPQALKLGMK